MTRSPRAHDKSSGDAVVTRAPPSDAITLRVNHAILAALAALAAGACQRGDHAAASGAAASPAAPPPSATAFYAATSVNRPSPAALAALGRELFFDPGLSASGTLACATCHDPAHAFAPADDRVLGRAVPSLRYLQAVPRFTEHFFDGDGDGTDQGPTGGYTWDGRAQTVHDQARLPLFSHAEMANRAPADVAAVLRRPPYVARLRALFGDAALATDDAALNAALLALEVFQQTPAEFSPYDSKYDAVLRGTAKLSAAEARGLALFEAPGKGNCASCHPSRASGAGFPAFTDNGFVALGVPRNRALPENADPAHFDLGLCGPLRTDLAHRAEYCGLFRTPSLRNVATRKRWFHNGAITRLADAVRFYATRDAAPGRWYPHGVPDDLPERYRANLHRDPPFGGKEPALTEAEIADLVAFLGALTDGYRAGS